MLKLIPREVVGEEGRLGTSVRVFPRFSISLGINKCMNLTPFTKMHVISTVTFP